MHHILNLVIYYDEVVNFHFNSRLVYIVSAMIYMVNMVKPMKQSATRAVLVTLNKYVDLIGETHCI